MEVLGFSLVPLIQVNSSPSVPLILCVICNRLKQQCQHGLFFYSLALHVEVFQYHGNILEWFYDRPSEWTFPGISKLLEVSLLSCSCEGGSWLKNIYWINPKLFVVSIGIKSVVRDIRLQYKKVMCYLAYSFIRNSADIMFLTIYKEPLLYTMCCFQKWRSGSLSTIQHMTRPPQHLTVGALAPWRHLPHRLVRRRLTWGGQVEELPS